MPKETLPEVMNGREPKTLMEIHNVSGVNRPEINLSELPGPPNSDDYNSTTKLLD
jgi:NADH-quinone oxidoreductase subunit G